MTAATFIRRARALRDVSPEFHIMCGRIIFLAEHGPMRPRYKWRQLVENLDRAEADSDAGLDTSALDLLAQTAETLRGREVAR